MSKSIVLLLIGCIIYLLPINGQLYNEKYRLQLHYSPPSAWMNDPNGLIYLDGYYHLFYQYNPANTSFGDMHWGHARSTDLIRWENLPVALKPHEKGMIFSGCSVFDKNNVTGLGSNLPDQDEQPLIAIYSLHDSNSSSQTQALAYSVDKGTTWTQYDANPIISNPGIPDFRDPNIFERYGKFYMVLAVFDKVSFYSSKDLINWDEVTDFGLDPEEGEKEGVWECPSLFSLKDEQNNEHDVLIVSENVPKTGSVVQYFIGQFNGTRYNTYNQSRISWFDDGHDDFAGVPYHNDPLGRIILVGWMANWNYAFDTPTSTWRGQMTIPRELGLKTVNGELYLTQRPVDELNSLVDHSRQWSLKKPHHMNRNQNMNLTSKLPFKTGSMLKLDYVINIENVVNGMFSIKFSNNHGEFVLFQYDFSSDSYLFDRRNSGNVTFSPLFVDRIPKAKRINTGNKFWGQILLDTASIEIFADDGLNVFSSLFFPTELYENIELFFDSGNQHGNSMTIEKLSVSALKSIWTE